MYVYYLLLVLKCWPRDGYYSEFFQLICRSCVSICIHIYIFMPILHSLFCEFVPLSTKDNLFRCNKACR